MKTAIYVDGQHGTTGIEIINYIKGHPKLDLIEIPFEDRRNLDLRLECIAQSDITILCLPEEASREIVQVIDAKKIEVKLIDTSTAFRTNQAWTYGLPELSRQQKEEIRHSKRIANPGCHASAAILLAHPLLKAGIMPYDAPLKIFSLTGYSGGGKNKIIEYENSETILSPKSYALHQNHKHVPEIMKFLDLKTRPVFMPVLGHYERGILLSLPVHQIELLKNVTATDLKEVYQKEYASSPFFRLSEIRDEAEFSSASLFKNTFEISVNGDDELFHLMIKIDNLGKGASGAAIQSINLICGYDEKEGL